MKQASRFALILVAALGAFCLGGCVQFHDQPLLAEKSSADFTTRTLTDAGLRTYLETNGIPGEWPRAVWDFNSLALAAFYYQPSLDVARARWALATAGKTTAGERPNPILSIVPGYNTTATIPSPWFVTPSLDIPIETAGKRGYRVAQATQLSEVARLNIASVAWQVRSAVRRSLLNLDAAHATEKLLLEQQKVQAENGQLIEAQLRAGAVSAFEVTQARVALNQTRFALHDARQQTATARLQLADAIGIPPAALDGIELSFEEFKKFSPAVPDAAARRQALLNRADILGALAEYAATQSALQLEVARQYPDIHLSPGYEYDQGDNKWSLGLSVTLPVFNHNQGAMAAAQARRTESAAKFNALQARVLSEIELAVVGYQISLEKADAATALKRELAAQLRAAQTMLEAGEISRVELGQRQLELNTAALAQTAALVGAQAALGALEDALQSPAAFTATPERLPRVSANSPP